MADATVTETAVISRSDPFIVVGATVGDTGTLSGATPSQAVQTMVSDTGVVQDSYSIEAVITRISEIVTSEGEYSILAEYWKSMLETFVVIQSLTLGDIANVVEVATLISSDVSTLTANQLVGESISIAQDLAVLVGLYLTVEDTTQLSGQLAPAFLEVISEVTVLAEAITGTSNRIATLSEIVILSAVLTATKTAIQMISEVAASSDTLYLMLEYNRSISEVMYMEFVIQLGQDEYNALVFNTETEAPYLYSNFPFNSFHKNLAAMSTGIFRLDGADDDGDSINSLFETGFNDFKSNALKRLPQGGVYLGFANDGSAVIKTVTSRHGVVEEDWYEEDVAFTAFDTNRLKVHDGLKSRYWKFKVANKDGSALDLDSFQLYPIILKRRIR